MKAVVRAIDHRLHRLEGKSVKRWMWMMGESRFPPQLQWRYFFNYSKLSMKLLYIFKFLHYPRLVHPMNAMQFFLRTWTESPVIELSWAVIINCFGVSPNDEFLWARNYDRLAIWAICAFHLPKYLIELRVFALLELLNGARLGSTIARLHATMTTTAKQTSKQSERRSG